MDNSTMISVRLMLRSMNQIIILSYIIVCVSLVCGWDFPLSLVLDVSFTYATYTTLYTGFNTDCEDAIDIYNVDYGHSKCKSKSY